MKKSALTLLASAMVLAAATGAHAQAAPTPPTFGAPVPGQCVLDEQSAMGTSNMGKAASDRLVQLKAMVDSELSPEAAALETEYKSLQAQQKTVTPATQTAFQAKAGAWEQKRDAFQQKAQLRQQEMQATQQQVLAALFTKMIPSINAVVTQKSCATVISADALLHYDAPGNNDTQASFIYANPAMDITKDVVAKLNSTGELLPAFDRQHLDQRQGAAAAPAAAPAKPAAAPKGK